MLALNININEAVFILNEDLTILEACKFVGIRIPRFCYHDILSIAGNCRMCLIRLETDEPEPGTPYVEEKFFVACATELEDDMDIITHDVTIRKVREEISQFLLLDHPLDCPICDQGGECDLQDQAKKFGVVQTKFSMNKFSVVDKNFNVFIKTIMTRCIHCTRCVRFASEIAGVDFFGTTGRGNASEIGTYIMSSFNSEISANVIDLCPVGAITAQAYTFKARPWELKSIETIDTTDSLGSNIYVNFTESHIVRILPKYNSDLNESIITDKARYCFDYMLAPKPLLSCVDLSSISFLTQKSVCLTIISDDVSYEIINFLKNGSTIKKGSLVRSINISNTFNHFNFFFNSNIKLSEIYTANTTCFLIAVNPRTESALLNAKIRQLQCNDYFKIYHFGYKLDSVLQSFFINLNINVILTLLEGKIKHLSYLLIESEGPVVLSGASINERGLNLELLKRYFKNINESVIFFNLYLHSNTAGILTNFFKPVSSKDMLHATNIFFINCKESKFLKKTFFMKKKHCQHVYWVNPHSLNICLEKLWHIPIKTNFEESNTFLNIEFRPQRTYTFFFENGDPKTSFNSFSLLRNIFDFKPIIHAHHEFIKEYLRFPNKFMPDGMHSYTDLFEFKVSSVSQVFAYPCKPQLNNFYHSTAVLEKSEGMQAASQTYENNYNNFY